MNKLPQLPSQRNVLEKTFIFDSNDNYINKILTNHGWKCLPKTSEYAKLKWIALSKAQHFSTLKDNQFINHFKESHQLTTKIGLLRTLNAGISDISSKMHVNIYPRSYDLDHDIQAFQSDFKKTAIMNLLKKFIINLELIIPKLFVSLRKEPSLKISDARSLLQSLIKSKKLFQQQDSSLYLNNKKQGTLTLKFHKRTLLHLLLYLQNFVSLEQFKLSSSIDSDLLVNASQQIPPYEQWQSKVSENQFGIPTLYTLKLLLFYYSYCRKNIKWFMSDGLENIWVLKPSQSSRGRHIILSKSSNQIKNYRNGAKIVQKYVQNVWIFDRQKDLYTYPFMQYLLRKKFDIRVWVLIKNFTPLQAFIYREGYLRIGSKQYLPDKIKELQRHLTNYSINKHGFVTGQQSYLLLSKFAKYLQEMFEIDIFQRIKAAILNILGRVNNFQSRNNQSFRQFQLFGFDIILDNQIKPWVLQCNMSPACQQRGQLKTILKEMGEGLLTILGLINGRNYQWQKLHSSFHLTMVSQKTIERQTLSQFTRQNSSKNLEQFRYKHTIIKKNELCAQGRPIDILSYLRKQNNHIKIQKAIILQRFWRQKMKNRKSRPLKQFKEVEMKHLISLLAPTIKRAKKYWIKKIVKQLKKIKQLDNES